MPYPEVEIVHLSTPHDFDAWIETSGKEHALFLVDYELLGFDRTGLDLLSKHLITSNGFLVTRRVQDEGVVAKSESLGVRIVPKSAAPALPMRYLRRAGERAKTLVLIDDDRLVRRAWKAIGASRGYEVFAFPSIDMFLNFSAELEPSTPIYVDVYLDANKRGDIDAERIWEKGFQTIYLATGEEPETIRAPHWVRGVVGKEGPFSA